MSGKGVAAEIAGTVLSIDCTPGQQVEAADILLIIESMKMEIPVVSPSAGRVSSISVAAGDVVAEGQPLLTIEG